MVAASLCVRVMVMRLWPEEDRQPFRPQKGSSYQSTLEKCILQTPWCCLLCTRTSVLLPRAVQMYQDAASMPIWQLHSGACVHIQEGAFLPPKAPASPAPDITAPSSSSSTAAGAAASAAGEAAAGSVVRRGPPSPNQQAGLGEEAREFIMQQLPLFQVGLAFGWWVDYWVAC